MTRILAFDQASGTTGWAIGDSRSDVRAPAYLFGSIKTPKRDNFGERLLMIFEAGMALCREHKPDMIAHEEPYFPHPKQQGSWKPHYNRGNLVPLAEEPEEEIEKNKVNLETLKQLQQVKGVITLIAAGFSIPVESYTPSHWRKATVGMGRAPKGSEANYFKKAVRKHFAMLGYETRTDDESDALGILFCALHGPEAAARAQGDLLSLVGGKL